MGGQIMECVRSILAVYHQVSDVLDSLLEQSR